MYWNKCITGPQCRVTFKLDVVCEYYVVFHHRLTHPPFITYSKSQRIDNYALLYPARVLHIRIGFAPRSDLTGMLAAPSR